MNGVLVVGAGSVGSRHVRNLLALGAPVSVYRYRQDLNKELAGLGHEVRVFDSLEAALESRPEAVVIANRTDQHVAVALEAAARGFHLFIEKPLGLSLQGLARLSELVRERGLVVEVGCMMRLHPNLAAMARWLGEGRIGRPYFARAVVGQYLPDWRPTADYRQSYSARRDQGGGVLLDLIHELDLLGWWFGPVREVAAMLGGGGHLDISSEAIAQINLRFDSDVLAQVHMDYLRPGYHRSIEIVGEKGQLSWDSLTGVVTVLAHGEGAAVADVLPSTFERNDMFVAHMRHFLERVRGGGQAPVVSLEDGIATLRVALAAHQSSSSRLFVRPAEVDEGYAPGVEE
jgi:predicted dehydrogenase